MNWQKLTLFFLFIMSGGLQAQNDVIRNFSSILAQTEDTLVHLGVEVKLMGIIKDNLDYKDYKDSKFPARQQEIDQLRITAIQNIQDFYRLLVLTHDKIAQSVENFTLQEQCLVGQEAPANEQNKKLESFYEAPKTIKKLESSLSSLKKKEDQNLANIKTASMIILDTVEKIQWLQDVLQNHLGYELIITPKTLSEQTEKIRSNQRTVAKKIQVIEYEIAMFDQEGQRVAVEVDQSIESEIREKLFPAEYLHERVPTQLTLGRALDPEQKAVIEELRIKMSKGMERIKSSRTITVFGYQDQNGRINRIIPEQKPSNYRELKMRYRPR